MFDIINRTQEISGGHILFMIPRHMYSNWTFIVVNLSIEEESKVQQSNDQISVSRDRKGVKHRGEHQGMIQAKVGMLWCTCRF